MHGCSKSIHVPCMFHAWLFQFIHVPCKFHAWLSSPCTFHAWLFQSTHVACMLQVTMHGMCWNMHVSGAPFSVGRAHTLGFSFRHNTQVLDTWGFQLHGGTSAHTITVVTLKLYGYPHLHLSRFALEQLLSDLRQLPQSYLVSRPYMQWRDNRIRLYTK